MSTLAYRRPWSVTLALVASLLTIGAGFCLFDTDGHDHDGVGRDLCTGILVVTFAAILVVALGDVGSTAERLGWAATPVSVSILDPPPRRGSSL